MGPKDFFEIVFEKDQDVFYEGDQVLGTLRIVNSADIVYRAISLELRGTAMAVWRSGVEKLTPLDWDLEDQNALGSDECSRETFFKQTVYVDRVDARGGEGLTATLPPGEHQYPFESKLPLELPSSFSGQRGWVRYEARLIVDGATLESEDDVRTARGFTVVNGLDLSFIPEAATKIEVCKYRDMGACCTEGSVTCDWSVARSGFVPGETIWVQGSVQNESKRTVTASTVTLVLIVDYRSGKRHKRERRLVASVEKEATAPGDMLLWNDPLLVPVLPPTGLGRCRLLDISYQLEFKAVIEGAYSPISITKDVYIGTVKMSLTEMRSFTAALYSQPSSTVYSQPYSSPAVYRQHSSPPLRGSPLYPLPPLQSPADISTTGSELSLIEILATVCSVHSPEKPSAPELASMDSPGCEAGAAPPGEQGGPGPEYEQGGPEQDYVNCADFIDRRPVDCDRPPPFAPGHESVGDYLVLP